jgi:Xaa-Pro dipeptidase
LNEYAQALEKASGGAAAREQELAVKLERLQAWLEDSGLDGILLRRHENLAWVTAGQVEARVGILSVTGIVTLLLLRNGRRYYFAPNNEAARLAAEEFPGLGYEPIVRPWHGLDVLAEAQHRVGGKLATDEQLGHLPVVSLAGLRAPLTQAEIARYRVLGAHTAQAVADVLPMLTPGITEHAMEARMAERLLREGIFPSVLLMAVDDRILNYKHAVARGAKLKRFGMLNLCTRRWGLAVSITRFVHFGPLPQELAEGFAAAAVVNAALQHASREGATASSLFETAVQAYADAGFPGEEQQHHQGGACGYLEREWVAKPSGTEVVKTPQAFAWNPSCRGGKVEDTTLAIDGTDGQTIIELLTLTLTLPIKQTEVAGKIYLSAAPLLLG